MACLGAARSRDDLIDYHAEGTAQLGSRMPSVKVGTIELSRYCRIVRLPTLMSELTIIPADGLK